MDTNGKVKTLWRSYEVCRAHAVIATCDNRKQAEEIKARYHDAWIDRIDTIDARDQYGDLITVRFAH